MGYPLLVGVVGGGTTLEGVREIRSVTVSASVELSAKSAYLTVGFRRTFASLFCYDL